MTSAGLQYVQIPPVFVSLPRGTLFHACAASLLLVQVHDERMLRICRSFRLLRTQTQMAGDGSTRARRTTGTSELRGQGSHNQVRQRHRGLLRRRTDGPVQKGLQGRRKWVHRLGAGAIHEPDVQDLRLRRAHARHQGLELVLNCAVPPRQ